MIRTSRLFSWSSGLLLAIGGGVLLSLAFPPISMPLIAWIGLVPVMASVFLYPRVQGWLNAIAAGVCYYTILYSWMQRFHSLSIVFISILFGIIFFAIPLLLSMWSIGKNWKLGFLAVPVFWVVFEYLKTLGPLSFGFGILGYSQYTLPRLIQSADIWGVYGISFFLIFINYTLFFCLYKLIDRKGDGWLRSLIISLIFIVLFSVMMFGYGEFKLSRELVSMNLKVQLVQFNHDARLDWGEQEERYLDEYEEMTMISQGFEPDLVIFPENSVKKFISIDPSSPIEGSARILNRISETASLANAALLLGVLESESDGKELKHYNSAFLFGQEGSLLGRYRKVHLVPFGETDPFNGLLPRVEEKLTAETDVIRLKTGQGTQPLSVENNLGEKFQFGTLICFEGTRGDFVRGYSKDGGVDFLVNITSDAWTESSGALEQHAAFCVFRAVENRRTLYRVGNGGLSGVINPKGIIVKKLPYFTRGVLLSGLTIPEDKAPGLYIRWGDWFIWICIVGVLMILSCRIVLRIKRRAAKAVCLK